MGVVTSNGTSLDVTTLAWGEGKAVNVAPLTGEADVTGSGSAATDASAETPHNRATIANPITERKGAMRQPPMRSPYSDSAPAELDRLASAVLTSTLNGGCLARSSSE